MAAIIPFALQFLPLLPGFIDSTVKLVNVVRDAVKHDPNVPVDLKDELEALSKSLTEITEKVKLARLPAAV